MTFPMEATTDWNDVTSSSPGDVVFNVQYELIAPLLFLILFTFAANTVVILCIRIHRPLYKPNNYFVVSLAVADALVGLIVMSGMLVYTIYGLWPLSSALCTAWVVSDFGSCTISIIHLCLIAHDRYLALAKPLQYRHSKRKQIICINIVITWVVGLLAWMPAVIWFRYSQEPVPYDCYFVGSTLYTIIQAVIVYYGPIVLMVVFYVQCLLGLRAQYHKINATLDNLPGGPLPDDDQNTVSVIGDSQSVYPSGPSTLRTTLSSTQSASDHIKLKKKARRRQEHSRSIRTLGVIIVIFLVCWLPFCIFWPIVAFCPSCIPAKWYEYSYWSAYLNSSINPLLYFLSNKDFRAAFLKLIGGKRK